MIPLKHSRPLYSSLPLALLALAVACAPQAPTPTTGGQTTAAPVAPAAGGPTGKLTVAESSSLLTSLDTGFGNDSQTLKFMWPAFDGLTWLSADGKINPGLAKEWRSVDATTWEFKLGDYKFQNGRAVEAQDVVDTYTRYQNPDKKLPSRVIFTGAGLEKAVAVDSKTVRLTTARPNPTLPNLMQLAMILPMKEVNVIGEEEFFKKPIGTGPFKVESANFQGSIVYTSMGKDFVSPKGVSNIKDLEIKIVPDISSRVAALRSGDVDLALALVNDQVVPLEQAGFKTFQTNGASTIMFNLDMYSAPTNDLKVRQAINYAIDKETILKSFYAGRGRVDTAQLIGPSVLGFNPSLKAYDFDRNKAKALLAEAGYANGFTIPMTIIQLSTVNKDLAAIVADQLREVGITVNIELKETAVWLSDYYGTPDKRKGMFVQVINFDQTFEPDSVYRWFSSNTTRDGGRRWEDPEFDRLYLAAQSELDRTKRGQLYQQAAAYLNANAPVLFGWQANGVYSGKSTITAEQPGHANFYINIKKG